MLPLSISLLTGLTVLSMGITRRAGCCYERILPGQCIQGCRLPSSLRILELKNNDLFDDDIPTSLHTIWPFLEELDLSENMFTCLPANISLLSHLNYLNLSDCMRLEELPELPSLIQVLRADRCRSLRNIGDFSSKYKWLFKISLHYCPRLLQDEESRSHLANLLMESLVQKCAAANHRLRIAIPGNKIPDWFSSQRLGNTISLKLPQNHITKMLGLALCCHFLPTFSKLITFFKIKFNLSGEEKLIDRSALVAITADVVWIGYMSIDILGNLCHGFESEDLIVSFEDDVVECGVCVVYEDDLKLMTGTGSWIPDYDEVGMIYHERAGNEDWQNGRCSKPTFYFDSKRIEDHKTVEVWV